MYYRTNELTAHEGVLLTKNKSKKRKKEKKNKNGMKFCRTPTLLSHASRILFSFTAAVVVVVVSCLLRFATTTTNLQFNKGKGGRRAKSGE